MKIRNKKVRSKIIIIIIIRYSYVFLEMCYFMITHFKLFLTKIYILMRLFFLTGLYLKPRQNNFLNSIGKMRWIIFTFASSKVCPNFFNSARVSDLFPGSSFFHINNYGITWSSSCTGLFLVLILLLFQNMLYIPPGDVWLGYFIPELSPKAKLSMNKYTVVVFGIKWQ